MILEARACPVSVPTTQRTITNRTAANYAEALTDDRRNSPLPTCITSSASQDQEGSKQTAPDCGILAAINPRERREALTFSSPPIP